MIICDNCGRENEDEYKFCLGCGSALSRPEPEPKQNDEPKMVDCAHCGTTVPSNFKFCGACGGAIKADAKPAAQNAPAPQAQAPQADVQADVQADGGTPAAQQQPAQASSPAPTPSGEAAPSATEQVVGRLIVIRPDGSEGAEIALTSGEHALGRDSKQKVLSSDPFLSPTHATFSFDGEGFRVRDEGSLNGVFVRVRDKIELRHEDMLRIGQELLRFELLSEVEPVIASTDDDTKLAGSPLGNCWGRLSLIAGPEQVSRAFDLGDDALVIGRETGDILFRDDGFVSGKHARISREGGKAVLEDLGSSNGTYRRIREETRIDDGALILMGQQLFRLVVI